MNKILSRTSNTVSISNFYEDFNAGKYDMEPKYQRKSIWSTEKKAFFIDSVLKNLPIPPIFLRVKLNEDTGRTTYEVVDGKQRLTSLLEFIDDQFPCSSDQDDQIADEALAGKYFSDLSAIELNSYKKQFWRFSMPVEYIDVQDDKVIDAVFDRLNRNGEPLTGQELRNSQYYESQLIHVCYRLLNLNYWKNRLDVTDRSRMEDIEFVSELVLTFLEGSEFTSTNDTLDELYSKHANFDRDWDSVFLRCSEITLFMEALLIDFQSIKVSGVSHLYGIWCFCWYCVSNGISGDVVSHKLIEFLKDTRSRSPSNQFAIDYKSSMASRTKDKSNRIKRKNAMIGYCLK